MIRTIFLLLSTLQALCIVAQTTPKLSSADSLTASKHVDSLIQVAINQVNQKAFDPAFEAVDAAEKTALEKFGQESVEYMNCCYRRGRD